MASWSTSKSSQEELHQHGDGLDIRIAIIGDSRVGKTSLLMACLTNTSPVNSASEDENIVGEEGNLPKRLTPLTIPPDVLGMQSGAKFSENSLPSSIVKAMTTTLVDTSGT